MFECALCSGPPKWTCADCRAAHYCSQLCGDLDLTDHSPTHFGRARGTNGISRAKAREMLKNPPHGRPLSDAQRRYFYWVANQ